MTCQLCGRVGHGGKICHTLNNYPLAQGSDNEVCQYCEKNNHMTSLLLLEDWFENHCMEL